MQQRCENAKSNSGGLPRGNVVERRIVATNQWHVLGKLNLCIWKVLEGNLDLFFVRHLVVVDDDDSPRSSRGKERGGMKERGGHKSVLSRPTDVEL